MDRFSEENKYSDIVAFKRKMIKRIPPTVSDTYRATLIKTINLLIDTPDPVNCTLYWKVNAEYVSNVEPPSHFVIALCLATDSLALEGQALEFQKEFYAKNADVAHHLNDWTIQGLINHHNKKILSGDLAGNYVPNVDGTPWNPEAIVVSHPDLKRSASAVEDMEAGPSSKRGHLAQEASTPIPFFENKDTPRLNFLAKAEEVPKDLRPIIPLMPEAPRSPSIDRPLCLPLLRERQSSPDIFADIIPGMKVDEEHRLDNGSLFNNPARGPVAPMPGMKEGDEHLGNGSFSNNLARFPLADYHNPFSSAREPSTFLSNDDYGNDNLGNDYGIASAGYNPGGSSGFPRSLGDPLIVNHSAGYNPGGSFGFSDSLGDSLPVDPSGGSSYNDNGPVAWSNAAPEAPMTIYSAPPTASLPIDAPIAGSIPAPSVVVQDSDVNESASQDSALQASADASIPTADIPSNEVDNPWIAAEQASATRTARLVTRIAQKHTEAEDKIKHANALRNEHAAMVKPLPLITNGPRGAYVTAADGDALCNFVMKAHDYEARAQKHNGEAMQAMFEASRLEKERYDECVDAGNKRVERIQSLVSKIAGVARDAQGVMLGARPGQGPEIPGAVKDIGDVMDRVAQLQQAADFQVQQVQMLKGEFQQYREYREFMRQLE
ncbi:hypothetical protein BDP81DRAFT_452184 [Colletotrichum phormii]|uniref:Uncharacterized protein n=1 Tax=Colletotrichum phormii TaxID=359342 RepID=A0AAJ0EBF9_9PEZI|nr:uncharacterized protein BDP81DRAFT_452184 [Colletotrichum phormii]KAK1633592.1 hypothetical protein BDP81DRAFT_452184 [Colletotrichum phormii]